MTPGQERRRARNKEIVSLAKEGMCIPEIAFRMQLTERYIYLLCKARGLNLAQRGRPRRYPLPKIGDRFGDYVISELLSATNNERVGWQCAVCGAKGIGYTFNLRRNPRCHPAHRKQGENL